MRRFFLCLLLLTLTACGGGSGNGLPTSNVAPVANAGSTQNESPRFSWRLFGLSQTTVAA